MAALDRHLFEPHATFCVFSRTEAVIAQSSNAHLLSLLFSPKVRAKYRAPIDLLFCELFPEWKGPCQAFYAGKGLRLFCASEMSPFRLLDLDAAMSDYIVPRIRELYLSGRRRWPTILKELTGPETQPRIEDARLHGALCRLVSDVVEVAVKRDQHRFNDCIDALKAVLRGPGATPTARVLAGEILLDRVRHLAVEPRYADVRVNLLTMFRGYVV